MTDPATAVSAAPLVALVAPFIVGLASIVVPALVGMGLAELRNLTGLRVQQAAGDKLDAMIADEVGALIAAAADNLATASIKVGSPIIAEVAGKLIASAPDLLAKAGITPDAVAGMVHGEIGKWQASMTRVAPAPAAPDAS
jgi:hypothetical protein